MTWPIVSLLLAMLVQVPMLAQAPSSDVVPRARAILTAIEAGDFARVEKQFTDDMKAALPPGALAAMWAKLLSQAGAYRSCGYWLDLRGFDAPSEASRVKTQMLILHGERDYQVTAEEFARWKAATGSRRDVMFHSYPALNHLFIAGTGPSLPTEYQIPGHVAEEVIRDIASWILAAR